MEGSLIDGRYVLRGKMGEGGEARVYRAIDEATGAEVAIRLGRVPARLGPKITPPSPHPGWARLLASGVDARAGGYLVLELLRGDALGDLVRRAPLPVDAWRAFVKESLAAVGALHAAGLVHGDLQAENFLRVEPSGWKLLDLPFWKFAEEEKRSALFGSIHTLAPERLDGAGASVPGDLYALGCLYYYAAAGSYPQTGSEAEIAVARLREEPQPLGEVASGFPSEWVMRLLTREREERFISAQEAQAAWAAALGR